MLIAFLSDLDAIDGSFFAIEFLDSGLVGLHGEVLLVLLLGIAVQILCKIWVFAIFQQVQQNLFKIVNSVGRTV